MLQLLPCFRLIFVFAFLTACSTSNNSDTSGGGTTTNSTLTGALTSLSVSAFKPSRTFGADEAIKTMTTKTITHVMAVSPSTGNAQRYVAAVGSDGTFSLGLDSGVSYLIVFVAQDGVLTGPDMIAGTVKVSSNDLDTLALTKAATVALGDVTVDGTSTEAAMSTSLTDLLTALGITSDEATFLGGIDDLALRLANPDVDNNGTIDALESKNFGMDWHVRANTQLNGTDLKISDIENTFANESLISLNWTLASGYAVYPTSFDDVEYPVNGGVDTTLQNGGAFSSQGTSLSPTSMSGGTFSSSRQWGPDYNMVTQEIGGSDAAATFIYTLGSASKQLIYSNVRTKTKAQLNADGVVLPFIKINTTANKFTGIDYKWMKKSGATWVAATSSEVTLLIQSGGAYLKFYTQKGGGIEYGVNISIPGTSATGTINTGDSAMTSEGVSDINNLALTDFCSTAMSYDDKMGLRIFAGAPQPNDGVTACP